MADVISAVCALMASIVFVFYEHAVHEKEMRVQRARIRRATRMA